jgi:hypothetical protein
MTTVRLGVIGCKDQPMAHELGYGWRKTPTRTTYAADSR